MKLKAMWRVTNVHGDSWVQSNRPRVTNRVEGEFVRRNITIERVFVLAGAVK